MITKLVPEQNIEIFCYLYCIENGLRELIIDLMNDVVDSRWYKERLPGDVLEKFREGRKVEKNIFWKQLNPHHPIYYVDFTDLKKIIQRQDNWKEVFEKIFRQKEAIINPLSELEDIRNKIAHNRKVTSRDLEISRLSFEKISDIVGKNEFNKLVNRCTSAADIETKLTELQEECKKTFIICTGSKALNEIKIWNIVCNEWWFDESYLGYNLEEIKTYFKAIEVYVKLPRKRGCGYKIESWVKSNDIETKYKQTKKILCEMLNNQTEVNP